MLTTALGLFINDVIDVKTHQSAIVHTYTYTPNVEYIYTVIISIISQAQNARTSMCIPYEFLTRMQVRFNDSREIVTHR